MALEVEKENEGLGVDLHKLEFTVHAVNRKQAKWF